MSTNKDRDPPFYALDDELPLILAISSGLQHALAMLAGLITPPIIFASALNLPNDVSAYMISASLIGCGGCLIQLARACFVGSAIIIFPWLEPAAFRRLSVSIVPLAIYRNSISLFGHFLLSGVDRYGIADRDHHLGILSLVQISRIHLFKNYYIGTGLITVVGTSFSTLSTANAVSASDWLLEEKADARMTHL
jgi:xanthine/uracil permease